VAVLYACCSDWSSIPRWWQRRIPKILLRSRPFGRITLFCVGTASAFGWVLASRGAGVAGAVNSAAPFRQPKSGTTIGPFLIARESCRSGESCLVPVSPSRFPLGIVVCPRFPFPFSVFLHFSTLRLGAGIEPAFVGATGGGQRQLRGCFLRPPAGSRSATLLEYSAQSACGSSGASATVNTQIARQRADGLGRASPIVCSPTTGNLLACEEIRSSLEIRPAPTTPCTRGRCRAPAAGST